MCHFEGIKHVNVLLGEDNVRYESNTQPKTNIPTELLIASITS